MKRAAEHTHASSKRSRTTDPHNPDPRPQSTWAPGLSTAFYAGGADAAAGASASGYNPFAPTYAGYGGSSLDAAPGTGLADNVGAGYGFGCGYGFSAGGFTASSSSSSAGHNTHNLVLDTTPPQMQDDCASARTSFTIVTPDANTYPEAYPAFTAEPHSFKAPTGAMGAMGRESCMQHALETDMMETDSPGWSAPPPSPVRARAHTVPTSYAPQVPGHPLAHHFPGTATGQGAHPGSWTTPSSMSAGGMEGYEQHAMRPRPLEPLHPLQAPPQRYPTRPAVTPLQPRR